MIIIKIIIILICAGLWRLGGWDKAKWSGYRDVMIPVTLFFYYLFTCNILIAFLTCGAANSIRMGYGAWDPEHDDKPSWLASITHDREGWKIRMIYGAITSFAIGLFPMLYSIIVDHHLISLLVFAGYVIGNTGLEFLLTKYKAKDIVHEPLVGAGRAVIVLCK